MKMIQHVSVFQSESIYNDHNLHLNWVKLQTLYFNVGVVRKMSKTNQKKLLMILIKVSSCAGETSC